ncbi:hypothetical protein [Burkholderia cenocepacia]|uniref:hypothetical protein n=1 Tax=Burkholderia cenocepacia TaxID=95486 RepID=UPI003394DA45
MKEVDTAAQVTVDLENAVRAHRVVTRGGPNFFRRYRRPDIAPPCSHELAHLTVGLRNF